TVRCKLIIDTGTGTWSALKWVVDDSKIIDWTNTGPTDDTNPLVLEWDRDAFDGGAEPTVLIVSPVTGTQFTWDIPVTSTLGANYDVRMRLRTLRAAEGGSKPYSEFIIDASKYFKICGKLVVSNPTINEPRIVNESGPITWTRTGNITNVIIECIATYGVVTSTFTINPNKAVSGDVDGINWVLDRVITPTLTAVIRVTNFNDPEIFDDSDNFIIRGKLTLTANHPGEFSGQEPVIGTNAPITWTTTGIVPDVILEYTDDSGTVTIDTISNTYSTVADVNTGYSWPVPGDLNPDPNNNVTITVRDARLDFKTDVYSTSANTFKIKPGITLDFPNAITETFTVFDLTYQNQSFPITWTVNGPILQVTLYYSKNGLAGPWTSIQTLPASDGYYNWQVPNDAISTNVRISVTNTADATINDYSDNSFKIRGKLILNVPDDGSQVWMVGSTQLIDWEQIGDFNVTIEYSTDDFVADFNDILVNNARADGPQTYSWPIPLDAKLSPAIPNIKVRIKNPADPDETDGTGIRSTSSFKIRGDLDITSPNSGTFFVDDPIVINWDVTGTNLTNAKLYYRVNAGGWNWFQDVTAWDKTFGWTAPDDISNNVELKITNSVDETTVFDPSGSFEIKGLLNVITPSIGQVLQFGSSPVTVTWNSTGGSSTFNKVKLAFSTDGGGTWNKMDDSGLGYTTDVNNVSGTNTYVWTIPDRVSANCLVQVASNNDWQNIFDNSDGFKIKGNLTLGYPGVGEVFTVNDNPVITC
ncbi:MAG: hypothetical protein KAS70_02805, partial [Planctomycetes bacterium]|nr:hypothetical protein [Planctomycetota bacterium]